MIVTKELLKAERRAKIKEEFGPTAQMVKPYKPNREQRRRQEALRKAEMRRRGA